MVTRMADCASLPLVSPLPLLAFLVSDKRSNWHTQENHPLPHLAPGALSANGACLDLCYTLRTSTLQEESLGAANKCSSLDAQLSRGTVINCIQFYFCFFRFGFVAGTCFKMCVYVCMCARTLVWECAWRLQNNLVCDFLDGIHFVF